MHMQCVMEKTNIRARTRTAVHLSLNSIPLLTYVPYPLVSSPLLPFPVSVSDAGRPAEIWTSFLLRFVIFLLCAILTG